MIDMAVVAVGVCYYCFICLTGKSIPCMFRLITGFKCPFCGLTSMAVYALNFRFAFAFESNPPMFFILPVMIVYCHICYLRNGRVKLPDIKKPIIYAGIIGYTAIRNICAF